MKSFLKLLKKSFFVQDLRPYIDREGSSAIIDLLFDSGHLNFKQFLPLLFLYTLQLLLLLSDLFL